MAIYLESGLKIQSLKEKYKLLDELADDRMEELDDVASIFSLAEGNYTQYLDDAFDYCDDTFWETFNLLQNYVSDFSTDDICRTSMVPFSRFVYYGSAVSLDIGGRKLKGFECVGLSEKVVPHKEKRKSYYCKKKDFLRYKTLKKI